MAVSVAQVKHLKGKQAEKFIKAFESSRIKEEAVLKAINSMKKGFIK